jgi:phosphatidylserine/phosphatidylglycerophosphate/cardiolipin synthase-like enzyme
MSQNEQQHPLITSFLSKLSEPSILAKQALDQPNYWTSHTSSLLTASNIHSVSLGTGSRVLETLLPALESAESEVLFVTCYWAQSDSLNRIADSLRKLSARNLASPKSSKTRVRICFSSSGVWQKLSHPQSRQGRTYAPSEWSKTLGLPGPEEMQGIDLQIKSVFFLPISIIHPKFVIIDRKLAFLPSCNVSWEEWFEGCVELSGPVIQQFVRFWEEFWADAEDHARLLTSTTADSEEAARPFSSSPSPSLLTHLSHSQLPRTQTSTLFLTSPHHRDPNFHPLPFQSHPDPPPTPLNAFLLLAFASAQRSIQIQTPNLTSQPAIEALLAALARGVEVSITTSENLQRIEQVVTAGTTTGRCVAQLVQKHGALVEDRRRKADENVEEASPGVGRLSVSYYQPSQSRPHGQVGDPQDEYPRGDGQGDEPVQSHFKLTIIDGEVAVFGSGNLDRASWFTSQELGVAFFGREFVGKVEEGLEVAMMGRRKTFFEG